MHYRLCPLGDLEAEEGESSWQMGSSLQTVLCCHLSQFPARAGDGREQLIKELLLSSPVQLLSGSSYRSTAPTRDVLHKALSEIHARGLSLGSAA